MEHFNQYFQHHLGLEGLEGLEGLVGVGKGLGGLHSMNFGVSSWKVNATITNMSIRLLLLGTTTLVSPIVISAQAPLAKVSTPNRLLQLLEARRERNSIMKANARAAVSELVKGVGRVL